MRSSCRSAVRLLPLRERAGHSSTQAADSTAKASRISPRAEADGTSSVLP
jgi:hypothetical protein